MPTTLSLEELQTLAARHTDHEISHDIVALMATVHPECCWRYEPIGCEITTLEAVAEMYTAMFPMISAMGKPDVINTWFSDDGFIGEVQICKPTPDGGEIRSSQFTWCEFNGDLVSGECNYLGAEDAGYIAQALGPAFFSQPGVCVTALR